MKYLKNVDVQRENSTKCTTKEFIFFFAESCFKHGIVTCGFEIQLKMLEYVYTFWRNAEHPRFKTSPKFSPSHFLILSSSATLAKFTLGQHINSHFRTEMIQSKTFNVVILFLKHVSTFSLWKKTWLSFFCCKSNFFSAMQLATSYNIAMWYFYINACKENIKVTKVDIELIYHTVGIKIKYVK